MAAKKRNEPYKKAASEAAERWNLSQLAQAPKDRDCLDEIVKQLGLPVLLPGDFYSI